MIGSGIDEVGGDSGMLSGRLIGGDGSDTDAMEETTDCVRAKSSARLLSRLA